MVVKSLLFDTNSVFTVLFIVLWNKPHFSRFPHTEKAEHLVSPIQISCIYKYFLIVHISSEFNLYFQVGNTHTLIDSFIYLSKAVFLLSRPFFWRYIVTRNNPSKFLLLLNWDIFWKITLRPSLLISSYNQLRHLELPSWSDIPPNYQRSRVRFAFCHYSSILNYNLGM